MAVTKIEWADWTFNPWIGCTRVSEGCRNCYAEREDARRGWTPAGWGPGKDRKRTSVAYWNQPLKWQKESEKTLSTPGRVFCASLADWADEEVDDSWRDDLFGVIAYTPKLNWLMLTKRPENARRYLRELHAGQRKIIDRLVYGPKERGLAAALVVKSAYDRKWDNVWVGVSVEDQKTADERLPILMDTPAAIRWVSYEPALGPVDFSKWLDIHRTPTPAGLDWIVVGGESGPKARPFHVEWAYDVIGQTVQAAKYAFVKQLGARPFFPAGEEGTCQSVQLEDRKGGNWHEWPDELSNLKVREFPVKA